MVFLEVEMFHEVVVLYVQVPVVVLQLQLIQMACILRTVGYITAHEIGVDIKMSRL